MKSEMSSRKRVLTVLTCITLAFFLLVGKLLYLQVFASSRLSKMSQDQRERGLPIAAKRGTIYDRNMNVLAMSASAKTVAVQPGVIESNGNADLVADKLSQILDMDRDTIYQRATKKASEVWVKRLITPEQEQAILAENLKGVSLVEDTKRYYPMENMLAQVIGYTTVDGVGQEGLEAEYEKYLAGYDGMQLIETDQKGNELPFGVGYRVEPTDGFGLVTTTDFNIQSFVENAMDECIQATNPKGVSCIVMDPDTAEVLAMGNKPDYDLNNPPRQDLTQLLEVSRNGAILDVYEPGSTFKVFTTAAALEENAVTVDSTFHCAGSKVVDGQTIKCWRTGRPHGSQTLVQGVCNSCNPVFMELGLKLGKDTYYNYVDAFGFGQYTNVDFSSDEKGIVMANKYVKNVDLARISFGQAIAVTPLQLITAFCSVINGGTLMEPHLVNRIVDSEGNTVREIKPTKVRSVISEATSATMRDILESVVEEGGGKNAYIAGYRVGGKTGTAQKYENGVIVPNKHISSFIGFAPANDPKIAVLFVVDEPSCAVHFGSVVAAPYVKSIIENTLKYMGIEPEVTAEGNQQAQATVAMPDVTGKQTSTASAELAEKGLFVEVDGTGTVTDQYPPVGTMLPQGAAVGIKGANSDDEENVFSSMD